MTTTRNSHSILLNKGLNCLTNPRVTSNFGRAVKTVLFYKADSDKDYFYHLKIESKHSNPHFLCYKKRISII